MAIGFFVSQANKLEKNSHKGHEVHHHCQVSRKEIVDTRLMKLGLEFVAAMLGNNFSKSLPLVRLLLSLDPNLISLNVFL